MPGSVVLLARNRLGEVSVTTEEAVKLPLARVLVPNVKAPALEKISLK